MKRIRLLLPVVLVVMMLLSFYKLVEDAGASVREYETVLEKARAFRTDGSMKYAEANYNKAIDLSPSVALYTEVAEFYAELGTKTEYVDWCTKFKTTYPMDSKAYELLATEYLSQGMYPLCFNTIGEAKAHGVETNLLNEVYAQIANKYSVSSTGFTDVSPFFDGYSNVMSNNLWGNVNMRGEYSIPAAYESIGGFSTANNMAIVKKPGEDFVCVDYVGAKVKSAKAGYDEYGLYNENRIPARKDNGKYVYLNARFEEVSDEFDYASTMMNGVAAVRTNDSWSIIGINGNTIGSDYSDIVLDENQIASMSERIFVGVDDAYYLIDISGNRVSETAFEETRPFGCDGIGAVRIGDKWGFIDVSGNIVIEPAYDDARSFNNGLAAVRLNSAWGFIDSKGNMIVEPAFDGAKDFNSAGSCFVLEGEFWRLLRFYRNM